MLVKKEFGQRAEHDGVFRASVTLTEGTRNRFWNTLHEICRDNNISCGYNRHGQTYDLGFTSQQDHDLVMNEVGEELRGYWKSHLAYKAHIQKAAERYADKEQPTALPSPTEN